MSDGRLDLTGNAGDTFEIEVTRGEATTKGTVFMLSDGTIAPIASISSRPRRPLRRSRPPSLPRAVTGRPAPRAALFPWPTPATPSARAPAAPPAPTAVVPVDRW